MMAIDSTRRTESQTYGVTFKGLRADFQPDDAKSKLAALFKTTPKQIDRLLSSPDYVLKKNVSLEIAVKYKAAVESAGGDCNIEPDLTHSSPTVPQSTQTTPITSPSEPSAEQDDNRPLTIIKRLDGLDAAGVKERFFANYLTMVLFYAWAEDATVFSGNTYVNGN